MNRNPNPETPISSFTLAELTALVAGEERRGLRQECIVLDSESHMQSFRLPGRIDAFIVGIGTEGETTVTFNLHEYTLKKDSLFLFSPRCVLQVRDNNAFKASVVAISPELLGRINIDTKQVMPLFLQFAEHPCIGITPEEVRELRSFITLLDREVRHPETEFTRDIVSELIAATVYKVGDILHRYLDEHPEAASPVHSRAEEYFKQFMELLGEHYRQERSVGFYARKLCITPKYLTTLIKRISDKSVSEWIDTYVILEAKTLLRFSDRSVQEIAYSLNFPNQSFFGSYFKRITGMSPSQYKATKE